VISLGVAHAPAQAQYRDELEPRELRALDQLRAGEYEEARDLLLRVVANDFDKERAIARYNLACAHAQLGEIEAAARTLRSAVEAGFLNLHQIKHDRDLAPLRSHNAYVDLIERWPDVVEGRTDQRVRLTLKKLSDGYIAETDERTRLVYVTNLDDVSRAEMKRRIGGLFSAAIEDVFGEGLEVPVLVVLPHPGDYRNLIDSPNIGGVYMHDHYQLITRTVGDSLQHELIHALHWADMDRLGQEHPIWIQEGLAAVFEDVVVENDRATPIASWRTNIVKRLEERGDLSSIKRLATMSRRRFMEFRPRRNYAEARAVFMYLASIGKLDDWYETYTRRFADDPSGVRAFERTLGKRIERIDRDYARWVADLPRVQEMVQPGDASLGVVVNDLAVNDGLLIEDVQPGTGADEAGLEPGDVIISLDRDRISRTRELTRALGSREVGDRVRLWVRRDRDYLSRQVRLTAR
jgi:hypothetical protein